MIRTHLIGAVSAVVLLSVGYAAGHVSFAYRAGDVIPVRGDGQCIALDTGRGRELGTFPMSGGRCHIRDWHVRNLW